MSDDQTVRVWNIHGFKGDEEGNISHGSREVKCIELPSRDVFSPTIISHPHTYLNKVVIGSKQVWLLDTLSCC
jgi:hypothetical protein